MHKVWAVVGEIVLTDVASLKWILMEPSSDGRMMLFRSSVPLGPFVSKKGSLLLSFFLSLLSTCTKSHLQINKQLLISLHGTDTPQL